jgi:hypothetical protein
MRIEVNDDAPRLRRRATPIQCGDQSEIAGHLRQNNEDDHWPHGARECNDCGNHLLSCRCSPGEA